MWHHRNARTREVTVCDDASDLKGKSKRPQTPTNHSGQWSLYGKFSSISWIGRYNCLKRTWRHALLHSYDNFGPRISQIEGLGLRFSSFRGLRVLVFETPCNLARIPKWHLLNVHSKYTASFSLHWFGWKNVKFWGCFGMIFRSEPNVTSDKMINIIIRKFWRVREGKKNTRWRMLRNLSRILKWLRLSRKFELFLRLSWKPKEETSLWRNISLKSARGTADHG